MTKLNRSNEMIILGTYLRLFTPTKKDRRYGLPPMLVSKGLETSSMQQLLRQAYTKFSRGREDSLQRFLASMRPVTTGNIKFEANEFRKFRDLYEVLLSLREVDFTDLVLLTLELSDKQSDDQVTPSNIDPKKYIDTFAWRGKCDISIISLL